MLPTHPRSTLFPYTTLFRSAIHFARALGINIPKVAILAGSDLVTTSMRSTVDAAALCKMAERGQIEDGILRSEEHTSELQSHHDLVCRLLLEKKKKKKK